MRQGRAYRGAEGRGGSVCCAGARARRRGEDQAGHEAGGEGAAAVLPGAEAAAGAAAPWDVPYC